MDEQRPKLDGARIRALREQRQLTAEELAHRADICTRHIWRLQSDRRPNSAAVVVARIALALDTSVEYLLGLTDNSLPIEELHPEATSEENAAE